MVTICGIKKRGGLKTQSNSNIKHSNQKDIRLFTKLDSFTFDPFVNEWWIHCAICNIWCEVWDIMQKRNNKHVNLKLSCGHVLGLKKMR